MHQVSTPDVTFFCTDNTVSCACTSRQFSNIFLDCKNNYHNFQLFASTYGVLVLCIISPTPDSFQIHDFYLNTYTSIKTI